MYRYQRKRSVKCVERIDGKEKERNKNDSNRCKKVENEIDERVKYTKQNRQNM